jgi:type II secretory pathway component PulF
MSTYFYQLLGPTGRVKTGIVTLEYEKDDSVKYWLERKYDGYVVSLWKFPIWLTKVRIKLLSVFLPSVSAKELCGFLYDLAVMTESGVPISDAVDALAKEVNSTHASTRVVDVAKQIRAELNAGATVSDAFDRMKHIFPDSVRSLIRIGDETGTTDKMLKEAASHLQRLTDMRQDIQRAMIYPFFVFLSIICVSSFWIIYVIPNLSGMFKQMNAKLPAFTVAVLNSADWFSKNSFMVLLVFLTFISVNLYLYWFNEVYKFYVYKILHRLPIFRLIVSSSIYAFITEYLAVFIRAGVEIVSSIRIMSEVATDPVYRKKLNTIASYVENGEGLSVAMSRVGGFPPVMLRLISVGENTGTLDKQLELISSEYRKKLAHVVATISEIVKPLVIIFAGGIFLILITALMLPIYDLIGQAMSGNSGFGAK